MLGSTSRMTSDQIGKHFLQCTRNVHWFSTCSVCIVHVCFVFLLSRVLPKAVAAAQLESLN